MTLRRQIELELEQILTFEIIPSLKRTWETFTSLHKFLNLIEINIKVLLRNPFFSRLNGAPIWPMEKLISIPFHLVAGY